MALEKDKTVTKTLTFKCVGKEFTNKETNVTNRYNQYSVIINGIPIVIQVPFKDTTGRAILEEYFSK